MKRQGRVEHRPLRREEARGIEYLHGLVFDDEPGRGPGAAPDLDPAVLPGDAGEGWVAPLWWTDGVGQADPGHLRLRRT